MFVEVFFGQVYCHEKRISISFMMSFLTFTNLLAQRSTPSPLRTPVQAISHFKLLGYSTKI